MWERPRTGESFIRASTVEAYVMREFLRNTALIECDYYNTIFEACFKPLILIIIIIWMFSPRYARKYFSCGCCWS